MHDAPRSGRTRSVTRAQESLIVDKTLHDKPIAATHWSTRTLAAQLGVGATTIRRVWQRNGLKPHRQTTFKLSFSPMVELLPLRVTPELEYLQVKWAAHLPFAAATALLKEILPIAEAHEAPGARRRCCTGTGARRLASRRAWWPGSCFRRRRAASATDLGRRRFRLAEALRPSPAASAPRQSRRGPRLLQGRPIPPLRLRPQSGAFGGRTAQMAKHHQPSLRRMARQGVACFCDKTPDSRDGQSNVVLDGLALGALRFGDTFRKRP
jgi:hypothetical protein